MVEIASQRRPDYGGLEVRYVDPETGRTHDAPVYFADGELDQGVVDRVAAQRQAEKRTAIVDDYFQEMVAEASSDITARMEAKREELGEEYADMTREEVRSVVLGVRESVIGRSR